MYIKNNTAILLGYNQFLCAESLIDEGQFSLSLFEDLNKLIEAVVLYDKVILLGSYTLPSGVLAKPLQSEGVIEAITDEDIRIAVSTEEAKSKFQTTMSSVFGSASLENNDSQPANLIESRVTPNWSDQIKYNSLFIETINATKDNKFEKEEYQKWLNENIYKSRFEGGSYYYFARSIVYSTYAEIMELDYAPDTLRLPITALAFASKTKPLPKALYDALVEKIHSEIDALTLLGMPVAVFVPPLTATLLNKIDQKNTMSMGF